MAYLAQLTDTDIGKQTVMPTPNIMGPEVQGAQIAQLHQQTQAGYQQQDIENQKMQRQAQLRNVYSQTPIDPTTGQPDPDKLTSNLYGAGFGSEAADFQKQQSTNDYLKAHANYMNGMEQTRANAEKLAELQKQATTAGSVLYQFNQNNPDLWKHPQTYSPIDLSKPPEQMTQQDYLDRLDRIKNGQELTPQHLASYDAAYNNIPDNLKVYLDSPEQFRQNPAVSIAKMQNLGSQSDKYMTEVQNAFADTQKKFAQSGNILTEAGELTPKGTIAGPNGDVTYTEQKRHDIAEENKPPAGAENEQDKLETQARHDLETTRGDKSLANSEIQRDAAASAYNRISQIQASGKGMNPVDYVDILGQVYKARTGTAPTEEVLKSARQATATGSWGKAYTYITGEQAPATTDSIVSSLKDMAQHMGEQADDFHDKYMTSRLDMPTHLNSGVADRIRKLGRGMSFAEATAQYSAPVKVGSKAERDALPPNTRYIGPDGNTYTKGK
jgi:hypothetical protein